MGAAAELVDEYADVRDGNDRDQRAGVRLQLARVRPEDLGRDHHESAAHAEQAAQKTRGAADGGEAARYSDGRGSGAGAVGSTVTEWCRNWTESWAASLSFFGFFFFFLSSWPPRPPRPLCLAMAGAILSWRRPPTSRAR